MKPTISVSGHYAAEGKLAELKAFLGSAPAGQADQDRGGEGAEAVEGGVGARLFAALSVTIQASSFHPLLKLSLGDSGKRKLKEQEGVGVNLLLQEQEGVAGNLPLHRLR